MVIRDPALKRVALAEAEGTLVLAVGGASGPAYEVSAWELNFAAIPRVREGRRDEEIMLLEERLRECAGNGSILYKLASAGARAGRQEAALDKLVRAVEGDAKHAGYAANGPDLASIRGEPGFPRADA